MDYGEWTDNSRGTYNKWDGIARSTTQVLYSPLLSYFFFYVVCFHLGACLGGKTILIGGPFTYFHSVLRISAGKSAGPAFSRS